MARTVGRRWFLLVAAVALAGLVPAESRAQPSYLADFCFRLEPYSDTLRVALTNTQSASPRTITPSTIFAANVRWRGPGYELVGAGSLTGPSGGPFLMAFQASGGTSGAGIKTCSFTGRITDASWPWTSKCQTDEPDNDPDVIITGGRLRTGTLVLLGVGSTCPSTVGDGPGAFE